MPISDVLGAASLSRPGVCTSTTRPASPYDGQMIYETDTDRVAAYNGSAWNYLTGTTFVDYTAFTPTWTNLTVGNGTQSFRYAKMGKFVHVQGRLLFGSTTSISGNVSLNAPITSTQQGHLTQVGLSFMEDAGTFNYMGFVVYQNANILTIQVYNSDLTYVRNTPLSSTVPMTWTTNDVLTINAVYEGS